MIPWVDVQLIREVVLPESISLWRDPTDAGCVAPIYLQEVIVRRVQVKETPAQSGEAIQAKWMTRHELAKLRAPFVKAKKQGDLLTWRRDKAVRD